MKIYLGYQSKSYGIISHIKSHPFLCSIAREGRKVKEDKMEEKKRALLENLAESTEKLDADGLEKVLTFAAGVAAGAACTKVKPETSAEEEKAEEEEAS